jgi:hypothetical protein
MNPIERAVARPLPEIIIDRSMRGKIFRQKPPLATRAIYIADCVEHLPHIGLALAPTRASRRDHRLYDSPLLVGDVARVTPASRRVRFALFVRPHGSPLLFPESAAIDRITGDSYRSRTFQTGSKVGVQRRNAPRGLARSAALPPRFHRIFRIFAAGDGGARAGRCTQSNMGKMGERGCARGNWASGSAGLALCYRLRRRRRGARKPYSISECRR